MSCGCWNQLPRQVPGNSRNVLSTQRRKSQSEWQQASPPFHTSVAETGLCLFQLLVWADVPHLVAHRSNFLLLLSFKDACDGLWGVPGQMRKRVLLSWKVVIFRGPRLGLSTFLGTIFSLLSFPWYFTKDCGRRAVGHSSSSY